MARGVDANLLKHVYDELPQPDLVLYLDVTPSCALSRKVAAGRLGVWECGLDVAFGKPTSSLLVDLDAGTIPFSRLAEGFVRFQTKVQHLYEAILGSARVKIMAGDQSVDALEQLARAAISEEL
jgi:thymidylate kinase